jgi:SH3-like domain-containing protein
MRLCMLGVFLLYLTAAGPAAQAAPAALAAVRLDTPSGRPVPRFVSLKRDQTNCRTGPSFDHPVRFIFRRAGAPVLVVAESVDHWRKIRDAEGDECWVHQTTLTAQSHVLSVEEVALRRAPAPHAAVVGRLAPGVLARLGGRRGEWLFVSAGGARGWIKRGEAWGADAPPAERN